MALLAEVHAQLHTHMLRLDDQCTRRVSGQQLTAQLQVHDRLQSALLVCLLQLAQQQQSIVAGSSCNALLALRRCYQDEAGNQGAVLKQQRAQYALLQEG
jgi:hypothetical protein